MKKAIIFSVLLIVLTGVGSVNLLRFAPYMVVSAVCVISVLVALNKVDAKYIPIYIYSLALALLWQTSMLGTWVVGVDIHGEFGVVQHSIANGWNTDWASGNNSSVVLGFVAPLLAKMGFDPVWQFKALYPSLYACAPVLLYYVYARMIGSRYAYFACLLIMIVPMFSMEMTSMVKSMVAQFLLALMLWVIFNSKMSERLRTLSAICLGGGVLACHYTVGLMMVGYLASAALILTVVRFTPLKRLLTQSTSELRTIGLTVVVCTVMLLGYYSWIGNGFMLKTVSAVGRNITTVNVEMIRNSTNSAPVGVPDNVSDGSTTSDEGLEQIYLKRTRPESVDGSYLKKQEPLVRTAIGLDWSNTSSWGKVFRVLQYLTQILLVLGLIYTLVNRKRYNLSAGFIALMITGFGVLGCCVFVPFFSTIASVTRFYQVALIFIAPAIVIGVEGIVTRRLNKRVPIVVCTVLLAYFTFTSGFVFEVSGNNDTSRIDVPSSIALSNYRTNALGIFSAGDRACVDWLVYEGDDSMPIFADYHGACLLFEYHKGCRPVQEMLEGRHYLFLSTDNTEDGRTVNGHDGGLRTYQSLPNLKNASIVFSSGGAMVYEFEAPILQATESEKCVIMFIDVWAKQPWNDHAAPAAWLNWWDDDVALHVQSKILPLIKLANECGILTIATDGNDQGLIPELNGMLVINDASTLHTFLGKRRINTILYAGYATNACILARDTGMRKMSSVGYNTLLIEDCSLPVPQYHYTYEQALHEINTKYGGTTTMAELETLFGGE